MSATTWQEFYNSDLQGLYALIAVPIAFLVYRVVAGRPRGGLLPAAAGFVDAYAIVFAIETILDPVIGGPVVRMLGLANSGAATAVLILFVLLGDFRVYLLVFGLIAISAGRAWTTAIATAGAWTAIVPVIAYTAERILRAAVPAIDPNSIWLLYEIAFVLVAVVLRARVVPSRVASTQPNVRAFLRDVLVYVIAYYALWVSSDLLIQIGGIDAGWALRVVPNQLYYALWVPFVYVAFFSRR